MRLLRPLVSARFQILFHSPRRGAFHLSVTVLVHYRSSSVFSLGGWTPHLPTGLACPAVLFGPPHFPTSPTGLSPSPVWFPTHLRLHGHGCWITGLLRFRSPLLAESFLFLTLLRCFSSGSSLSLRSDSRSDCRVSPFGHQGLSRLHTARPCFSQCTTSFVGT